MIDVRGVRVQVRRGEVLGPHLATLDTGMLPCCLSVEIPHALLFC